VLVVEPDAPSARLMAGTGMDGSRRPAIARHVRDTVLDGVDQDVLAQLLG
jgi:hypothetical protein